MKRLQLSVVDGLIDPVVLISKLEILRVKLLLLRDYLNLFIVERSTAVCRDHSLLKVSVVEVSSREITLWRRHFLLAFAASTRLLEYCDTCISQSL